MTRQMVQSPETPTNIELLNEGFAKLAEDIRVFSQSQVDTWRQLPYLALQTEGNSGYSSLNSKLYRHGVLHIMGEAEGLYGTFVDCDNGNILRQSGKLELDRTASDIDVVKAWLPNGDKFDAQSWLKRYQKNAVEPHSVYSSKSEEQVREWRYDTARQLGLLSIFRRAQPVIAS